MSDLKDRFKKFLDHYSLSPDSLSKKIGGSRGTYFSIQNGKSKPDFSTSENILNSFPEISAEWWFRGKGPMLTSDILSKEEAEELRAENKVILNLYEKASARIALMGKTEGANISPDFVIKKHRGMSAKTATQYARHPEKRSVSKPLSVRVQGVKIPSIMDLLQ